MILNFLTENHDIIARVFRDIEGVTQYINAGIWIALIYVAVYLLYVLVCKYIKRERRLGTGHAVSVFALLIYLTCLLYIVFMSREAGEFDGVNLVLWSTWGPSTLRRALFIENIIMFVPMGVLLPCAFKVFRNPFVCIVSCTILSCLIEQVQFVFGLGYAELDDVVTNTMGGTIGWGIWGMMWLVHYLLKRAYGRRTAAVLTDNIE